MISLPTTTLTTTIVGSGATAVPVACIDPKLGTDRVFLVGTGFGAGLDPFEVQRFGLIAHRLRARLLIPETPGFSFHARTRLTRAERVGLLRNDFHPTARRMLHAALTVDAETSSGARYGVLGYSLGASLVAAMTDLVHNDPGYPLAFTTVVLVEPVANRQWRLPAILRANRSEERFIEHYLRRNREVANAVDPSGRVPGSPKARLHLPDLLLLANALRAGRLSDDLRSAARRPYTLVIARGRDSRMSGPGAARQLMNDCRKNGITAVEIVVGGGHGLWQSLPEVDDLATRVVRTLGADT